MLVEREAEVEEVKGRARLEKGRVCEGIRGRGGGVEHGCEFEEDLAVEAFHGEAIDGRIEPFRGAGHSGGYW